MDKFQILAKKLKTEKGGFSSIFEKCQVSWISFQTLAKSQKLNKMDALTIC